MPAYGPIIAAPRQPATFEDSLRDLLRSSPHVGFAVAVHGLVLLIFANMGAPPPELVPNLAIISEPPRVPEPFLPPPDPPEPEPVEPTDPVDDPIVEEDPVTEPVDDPIGDDAPVGPSDVPVSGVVADIGVGGGLGGGGDGLGKWVAPPTLAQQNDAVVRALQWLADHQSPEGHWSAAAFDDECGKLGDDVICDGPGNPQFDVGVTGLSLLAFLGAGQTTRRGVHKDVVRDGLDYLRRIQADDGNFGDARLGQHTYDHLIATLAMLEAYARDPSLRSRLRGPIADALDHTLAARNPGGAWRYAPDHPEMLDPARANDSSVTGWAVLVLTSAEDLAHHGLRVDAGALGHALADAMAFLDAVTDPETGRTGYTRLGEASAREKGRETLWPSSETEALTAVALLSRIFADPDLQRSGHRDLLVRGIDRLRELPPVWTPDAAGRVDFYYWYYGSYALFQAQELDPRPYRDWSGRLNALLEEHQHLDGERRGSWDPQADPWGHLGGRVYATALLALTLEVGYRYDTVLSPR